MPKKTSASKKSEPESALLDDAAVSNAPASTVSPESIAELEAGKETIEKVKSRERKHILSPEEFEAKKKSSNEEKMRVISNDKFAFRAYKDYSKNPRGDRKFNVIGRTDVRWAFRGGRMSYKKGLAYFLGAAYDEIFSHNQKDVITVNAWVKEPNKEWYYTTISKNELVGPEALGWQDIRKIIEELEAKGHDVIL